MMIKLMLRRFKFLLIRLFRIKGNSHKISLGFTLGFLVNFIPTFGIGPFLSVAGAKVFRGNPVAGLIGGVSLTWLFPLLFYMNVLVGEKLLPSKFLPFSEGVGPAGHTAINAGMHISTAFFLGMLVNMILFGMAVYYFLFMTIQKHRLQFLSLLRKWEVKK